MLLNAELAEDAEKIMEILQPGDWKRPSGYSNGIKVAGELIFVAGQIGWNKDQDLVSKNLEGQVRQALENIVTVLREAGARPEHLVKMTWYVVDLDKYRSAMPEIGEIYREVIGKNYPAMSLVEVKGLLEENALVEIEAMAVVP